MTRVSFRLRREVVRVDPGRIDALEHQLGAEAAESVICRAADELMTGLAQLRDACSDGDRATVTTHAGSIARIAGQVGLVTLARVAGDVRLCAVNCDGPAYHATCARLLRLAEGFADGNFDCTDQIV